MFYYRLLKALKTIVANGLMHFDEIIGILVPELVYVVCQFILGVIHFSVKSHLKWFLEYLTTPS